VGRGPPRDLAALVDAPLDPDRIERHVTRTGDLVQVAVALREVQHDGRRWVLVSVQDLTARVRAEEAARRSERVYRAIIENSFDGVSLLGPDLQLHEVDEIAARALGGVRPTPPAERRDLIHPADRGVFAEAVAKLAGRPGEREAVTYRTRDAGGRWHWLEGTLTHLADDPDIGAYVLNYHDVTARVRAAEEVAHLNAQLERRLQHLQALRRIDMAITNAIDVGWPSTSSSSRCRRTWGSRPPACCCTSRTGRRCSRRPGAASRRRSPRRRSASARRWRATPPGAAHRARPRPAPRRARRGQRRPGRPSSASWGTGPCRC
jgi:PAS domain S-box-containing protein